MWWEGVEQGADAPPRGFLGALGSLAQQVFELCEDLLDRVEVGAVGRQEQEARAFGPDRGPDGGLFVAGEIIQDDDIAWLERRTELLLDPLREGRAIDRLIEDERGIDPVAAQSSDEGHGFPVAIRHLGMEPLAFGCPAPQWGHVGFGPCLVHEDEPGSVRLPLILLPLLAPSGDLGPQLFGGKHAFF